MPDYRSAEAQAYRAWYKLARWRRIRAAQLQAEPLCRYCAAVGKVAPATIVDHVKPHRGRPELFWHGPLQSLCAPCHDRHAQVKDRGGVLAGADLSGFPLDPAHYWNHD
jgi:5-methylcytosine-specific restriction protein A